MNLLPFGKLAAHRSRMFVPQNVDLGDWPHFPPRHPLTIAVSSIK
jgi:hypothetical protein